MSPISPQEMICCLSDGENIALHEHDRLKQLVKDAYKRAAGYIGLSAGIILISPSPLITLAAVYPLALGFGCATTAYHVSNELLKNRSDSVT